MNTKYKSIIIKVISSLVFMLLFFFIAVAFELVYRGSVTGQINSLVHNILFFGIK
jgi:hypothetical protein